MRALSDWSLRSHTLQSSCGSTTECPVIMRVYVHAEASMRSDARTEARLCTHQARKYKAMCLAGPDASKVAIGRVPPQVGILLANSTKASSIPVLSCWAL